MTTTTRRPSVAQLRALTYAIEHPEGRIGMVGTRAVIDALVARGWAAHGSHLVITDAGRAVAAQARTPR